MGTFLRSLKRAADRLDRTVGWDAPPGTRPYASVGDALSEVKRVLDALDEAAGLSNLDLRQVPDWDLERRYQQLVRAEQAALQNLISASRAVDEFEVRLSVERLRYEKTRIEQEASRRGFLV